ncbi:MAG: hypothetical protein WBM43_14115 [Flavobacteriaceae bacterium]
MELESKKTDFKAKLEAEILEWKTKMDEMKVQMELGSMEARQKLEPELNKLELQYDKVVAELEKLDEASEYAWEEIKNGVSDSVATLKKAFNNAKKFYE